MFLLLSSTIWGINTTVSDTLKITSKLEIHRAGTHLATFEDSSNTLELQDVIIHNSFIPSTSKIPNFEVTKSTYWAKLIVQNLTDSNDEFILKFEKITANELAIYHKINDYDSSFHVIDIKKGPKKYLNRHYLFDFNIPKNKSITIYIKYKTNWATTFPVVVSTKEKILESTFNDELIKGIYIGILFIMVFYNLFIYFSIKDKSYLYYVVYIFLFLLLQLTDLGYTYKLFFYNHPIFFDISLKILPSLTSIAVILFVRNFLRTRIHIPLLDKGLNYIIIAFILMLGFVFDNQNNALYFSLINSLTLFIALYLLVIGIVLSIKGTFLAKYFLIAWSLFLLSIIQFNLSNLDLIPYYEITDHSLEIGSIIEVFLLSLALAHRIHLLKKEKEISQEEAIQLIQERKQIIQNQNEMLEDLVAERTKKLETQNKIISEKNEEKSIMMQEIHHRVKNNLQMINSMIRLQNRHQNNDNSSLDSLKEVERRIFTMALLHEKMYQSENLVSIDIKDYMTSIIDDLLQLYKSDVVYEYTIETSHINLNAESVLYIGLLLNELITNSLKHAFKSQSSGYLYISLHETDTNKPYRLNVSNNGERIDIDKFNNSTSLGHRLIKNFVKQLDGKLTIQCNEDVTTFSILFNETIS